MGVFLWGLLLLDIVGTAIIAIVVNIKETKKPAYITSKSVGKNVERSKEDNTNMEGIVYDCQGARGRHLAVYPNKVVISVKAGAGSLLTGNATDGEKTIYFSDCVGIQYKECGITLGYLQFETAGALMNNRKNNFFNENTFTWDTKSLSKGLSEAKMKQVADYCKQRVDEVKTQKTQAVNVVSSAPAISPADELLKYKGLFDAGVLTQEEFEAKKKQLLGL